MRPARQIKVVTSQLEGFMNLKKKLDILLEDINNVIKKGECWLLGNNDSETFLDIIHSLDMEMETCLKQICNIAAGDQNVLSDVPIESNENYLPLIQSVEVDNKTLFTQFEELSNSSKILSKKLKSLQDKHNVQETLVETISKNYTVLETKYNSRFDDIMTELHTASDFIQSQTEIFYEKVEQCEEKYSTQFKESFENINTKLVKRQEEYENCSSSNFNEIKIEMQTVTQILSDLKQENEILSSKIKELEQTLTDIPKNIDSPDKELKNDLSKNDEKLQNLQRNYTEPIEKEAGHTGSSIGAETPDRTADDYGQVLLIKDTTSGTYICGSQETQLSEGGEADLHKHYTECKKNPGHTGFIPVNRFTINDLPVGDRNQELYEYIKDIADLTVRVDVKLTSLLRPEYWPNTQVPFPFHNMRGNKTTLRTGSGIIWAVRMYTHEQTWLKRNKCWCKKCEYSCTASKVWWEFNVSTTSQVVFDDIEACHTSVRLFYNSEVSQVVSVDQVKLISLNQVKIFVNEFQRDYRELNCVTCNIDLGEKLHMLYMKAINSKQHVFKKYTPYNDLKMLNFIVSHPHGCSKVVSFGHCVNKYKINEEDNYVFTYTTCTCPGSSGAMVHCLGHIDTFHHLLHSGNLNSTLNFSCSARLWKDLLI